jgi:hypothetical protein
MVMAKKKYVLSIGHINLQLGEEFPEVAKKFARRKQADERAKVEASARQKVMLLEVNEKGAHPIEF